MSKKTPMEILDAITEKYLSAIVDPLFRSYRCNEGQHDRCGWLIPHETEYCQCQCHQDME